MQHDNTRSLRKIDIPMKYSLVSIIKTRTFAERKIKRQGQQYWPVIGQKE